MVTFPITAKLIPRNASNIKYLIATAAIARLGVAALRVEENRPSKNKNAELTPNQKRQSIVERFFVEVPGTVLFTLLPLHMGQDLASKFFEKHGHRLNIPQIKADDKAARQHLRETEIQKINDGIRKVFGVEIRKNGKAASGFELSKTNIIYRRLFGKEVLKNHGKPGEKESINAGLSSLRKELGPELHEKAIKAMPELTHFAKRLNVAACGSIMGGVVLSALFGGLVTQRMNDSIVAPQTKKWLQNHYPEGGQTLPVAEPDALPEQGQKVTRPDLNPRPVAANPIKAEPMPALGNPVAMAPEILAMQKPNLNSLSGIDLPRVRVRQIQVQESMPNGNAEATNQAIQARKTNNLAQPAGQHTNSAQATVFILPQGSSYPGYPSSRPQMRGGDQR